MATKAQLIDILKRLTDEPINQAEMGGCVWCDGTPKGVPYGYATSNYEDHYDHCEWVEARKLLGYMSGE